MIKAPVLSPALFSLVMSPSFSVPADAPVDAARPFIELRSVTCGYGQRVILEDISLTVPRGKVVALMGTSGGGKTTVLRLIGRQIQPMKGQVLIDGQDMSTLDAEGLMAMRRRMGMLFQQGALFTDLTVFENVAFPLREHTQLPESILRDLVLMKLNAVGLRGARDLMPSQISGGMSRRVALARAMALDPEVFARYGRHYRTGAPMPEAMFDKIMLGKEKKFREESSIMKQAFVKDPSKTVEQHIGAAKITTYVRVSVA